MQKIDVQGGYRERLFVSKVRQSNNSFVHLLFLSIFARLFLTQTIPTTGTQKVKLNFELPNHNEMKVNVDCVTCTNCTLRQSMLCYDDNLLDYIQRFML